MLKYTLFAAPAFLAAGWASAQSSSVDPIVRGSPVEIQGRRAAADGVNVSRVSLTPAHSSLGAVTRVADEAANLFVADSGARGFTSTYSLRGFTNTPLFGDPAVTLYIDDLPLGSGFSFPSALPGVTAAELSRGLGHGTRFGRAGSAGVLQMLTPETTSGATMTASVGNFSARTGSAQVSAGHNDSVDVYAAAGYEARDGFIENTRLGRDIDWRESSSGLARLRFGGSERAEYSLLFTAQRVRDGVQPLVPLGGELFEVDRSAEGVTHQQSVGVAGRAILQTELGAFSATTGFSNWKMGPATNVLNLGFAELANDSRLEQRTWSEEIRFVATNWTAGFFGMDERTRGEFRREIFSQPFEHSNFETEHRSLAAFGEAIIDLSSGFELKPGVRVEVTRKEMSRVERIPTQDSYTRERNSSALLPKLELGYTVDALTSLSARWAAGYKPGGFSAFTGKRELAVFGPERSHGIDLAFRRGSVVRGLDVVVRAFGYEIDGYQIERSFQTGGMADDYLVVNAEKAHSVGGEVEAVWKPLAGLEIAATYGITRVRLESFRDPYTQTIYDGNRAPYVPSRDLAVAVRYDHTSGVFAEARVAQVGRTFYTEAEDGAFSQASYSLVGGRVGWRSKLWEISGYVENATDREYYAAIIPGTFHAAPGAPRTYGVRMQARF